MTTYRAPVESRTAIASDRSALVERLATTLSAPDPRSVVLRGPAGIGKSYVAARVVERLERHRSVAVRQVFAGEAQRALDFGALLHVLPIDAAPVSNEFELVQRLRRGLVEQATPTVVNVDDAAMLDQKSAAILEGLIRAGDITVLVSERTAADGVRQYDHHLSAVLRDRADGVVVGPLGVDRLVELLVEWQGPGEVGSLRRMAALSEGNPLALSELLESARASSAIAQREGLWFIDEFVPHGRSIEHLVASHLDRLSHAEWDLLRTVAIAGAVPRAVLARLDQKAVESLERADLVAGDPCVLVHPLYAEVIRGQVSGTEIRELFTKLTSAAGPDDGVDPARLAEWMLESASGVDDRIARLGAAVAVGRWENPLAQRLIAAISEPTAADLVQLVWAHANDGDLETAQAVAERAVEAAETETERVDAGLTRAELWCLQLGRSDEGYVQLAELRDSLDQPDQRARVDGATVMYMRMTGKGTLAAASTASTAASDVTNDNARLSVLMGEALDKVFTGSYFAAEAPIVEGYEIAERISKPHMMVRLAIADAVRHFFLGDFERAREVVDRWLRVGDVSMARPAHAVWLGLAAQLGSFTGDFERAVLCGREAVRSAERVDDIGVGGFVRGELRAALIEQGMVVDADPDESPLGRTRAELRLAPADAVDERAAQAAEHAVRSGYVLWAPWLCYEAMRRGPAPRAATVVTEVAKDIDGTMADALVAYAQGDLHADRQQLGRAADLFRAVGAAAPAVDALLAEAERSVAAGMSDEVSLRRRVLVARSLTSEMKPAPPPRVAMRLDRLSEQVSMPSDRQLEIARLVARGRTSKEVAAELVVSARTVDNHLAAVYRQLGLSGRHELAELPL